MTDLIERLRAIAEQSEMGRNMAGTPQACRQAADEIAALRERVAELEGALSDLVRSCSSTPVAMGDGGTYIVGPPSVDALRAATILLREQG